MKNLFLTDSLITLYNRNILYLNSVRQTLKEDISFQDSEIFTENSDKNTESQQPFTEPILEDSLLRVFVSQQDKYNPKVNEHRKVRDAVCSEINVWNRLSRNECVQVSK